MPGRRPVFAVRRRRPAVPVTALGHGALTAVRRPAVPVTALGHGALDVLAQDPPVGAAALERAQVDARLARDPPRRGRRERASVTRRPRPADRRRRRPRSTRPVGPCRPRARRPNAPAGLAFGGGPVGGHRIRGVGVGLRPGALRCGLGHLGLEHGEHGADGERLARGGAVAHDRPGGRRRDVHRGLVGLDLHEHVVLAHGLALAAPATRGRRRRRSPRRRRGAGTRSSPSRLQRGPDAGEDALRRRDVVLLDRARSDTACRTR